MTNEECLLLKQDAKDQLHALRTGQKARVIVDKDGSRVEFSSVNQAALIAYVADLERLCPTPGFATQRPLGPATFSF